MAANTTTVVRGAGKWYIAPWTSGAIDLATLCVEANLIGYTQGGATVTYTPETYTVEDDIGMVRRTFVTKGEATMKTGLLTFDVASLAALQSVGEVTTSSGKTTFKLTGGKSGLKKFMIGFVYEGDTANEKISIGMVGSNTNPLELAFAKDKETVVDVEFASESNGVDDTVLLIEQPAA